MARKSKKKKMIIGTFCERELAPKSEFDSRSFRYKRSGRAWVLVGCPAGKYDAKKRWLRKTRVWEIGKCNVGTRSHKLLVPLGEKSHCPQGSQRITKA